MKQTLKKSSFFIKAGMIFLLLFQTTIEKIKSMKNIYIYLLIGIMQIFLGSCENIVIEPVSSITDANYWKTKDQFAAFGNGVHNALRNNMSGLWIFGSGRSDEWDRYGFGALAEYPETRCFEGLLDAENPYITGFAGFYYTINQINLLIVKTSDSDVLNDNEKNYLLGQCYGLRAFYYFHLLRSYGDVILHQDPTLSIDIKNVAKPASKAADVMAFIKADIESSISHFANDYSFNMNQNYWSKAATLMLKSEVYLWSAKQMGGGTTDATVAKAALTEIQTNIPTLGLQADFKNIFAIDNKNNNEIIFAIRYAVNECMFMFVNATPYQEGYWWRLIPTRHRLVAYYDSLENRKIADTDFVGTDQGGQTYNCRFKHFRSFSNQDSRKLASLKGVYRIVNDQYDLYAVYPVKYPYEVVSGLKNLSPDWPVYRYADLLLLLAEAKSMLAEDPSNEINLVRKRAFGTNYQEALHGYPNQPGDNDINEALLKERLFEFYAEGKRWYDLRRFGNSYVFKYSTTKEEYKLLWPIDKGELTNNKALVQNPGY